MSIFYRVEGITLKDYFKAMSLMSSVVECPPPPVAVMPLLQHRGLPAQCLVKPGQIVRSGDLIGKAAEGISAPVHASISGRVRSISTVKLFNGLTSEAVEIIRDESIPEPSFQKVNWKDASLEELLGKIRDAGIVGLGGAAFPSIFKIKSPNPIHTLIINGAECEPYITTDQIMMREKTKEILEGIEILKKITGTAAVWIGIEGENRASIHALEAQIAEQKLDYRVKILDSSYPQGDEKLLIRSATGVLVPAGKLPGELGMLVLNVSTVYAIYEAVVLGKPLFERVLTLSGPAMKKPQNVRVRFGSSLEHVINSVSGLSDDVRQIIVGGPFMGFAQADLSVPVTKAFSGILAFSDIIEPPEEKELACIRCSRCIDACPFGIQPQLLYDLLRKKKYAQAQKYFLAYCKECGCCDYVCPARIPLNSYFKKGKAELSRIKSAGPKGR